MINFIRKGGLVCLILIFTSCASTCNQWQFEATITACPCYNSGRMTISSCDPLKNLSLELVRGSSGLRVYLNTHSLPFPCDPNHPDMTSLLLTIDGVDDCVIADRFQGGQRLLLPPQTAQKTIEKLLANKSLHITVGRYHAVIESTCFSELYKKLCEIPIAQKSP